MKKYKVYQNGGEDDASGADTFNGYIDQLIASQQPAQQPVATSDNEEESDYITGLRSYDEEQTHFNPEEYFKSSLDKFMSTLDEKLFENQSKQNEYDWFASDDGNDYIANTYDTRTASNSDQEIADSQQDQYPALGAQRPGTNNYGNIRGENGQFRSFPTPQAGRQALVNQLNLYRSGKTRRNLNAHSTLYDAMSVYAPTSDNNNPKHYAEFIAKKLGIDPNTEIKDVDVNKWADAITAMEGNTKITN